MSATTIHLVRHGATEYNLRRPYILQGRRIDAPLCDLGSKQAAAVGESLRSQPLAAVYTSPFVRARQTAAAIAAPHGLDPVVVPDLGEIDVGEWEGLAWDDVKLRWPEQAALFDEDAATHGYHGGENFFQLRDRALPALLAAALPHPGEAIAVVAHNVVNRVLLAHWMGVPLLYARRIPQANAGVNVVSSRDGVAKVQTINLIAHLSGLLPDD